MHLLPQEKQGGRSALAVMGRHCDSDGVCGCCDSSGMPHRPDFSLDVLDSRLGSRP